jgi:ACS family sodium-dependent inorganic phosphate cotransporter/ACS family sodium-dependent inorganic phosphate cotransporter-like MFS transporter 9
MSTAVLKAGLEFGWSDTTAGLVQSAFLWGYMATQLLGGILADLLGGKTVMAVSVVWFSVATALTPLAAGLGQVPLLFTRALVGLGEGVALPSMNNLIGKNVKTERRATALGISFAGFHSGNILGLLLSPYLISNYGWRSLFYIFGLLGVPVLILWQKVVPNNTRPTTAQGGQKSSVGERQSQSIPLSKLVSSTSAWAIFVANFVNHWGYFIYLSWLPTYFNRQFSLDIAKSSIFSLLPWLVMAVCSSLSGVLADSLISRGMRVKNVRKLLQCTSFAGTATTLLVITNAGNRLEVAVPFFMLALGMKALGQAGFVANMSDIAVQSSGKLFGLSNTLGSFAGILSVSISGYILEKTGSFTLVFQLTALMYIIAALVYFCLCDDKPIPQQ